MPNLVANLQTDDEKRKYIEDFRRFGSASNAGLKQSDVDSQADSLAWKKGVAPNPFTGDWVPWASEDAKMHWSGQDAGRNADGEQNPPIVPNPYGSDGSEYFTGPQMYAQGGAPYDGRGTERTDGEGGQVPNVPTGTTGPTGGGDAGTPSDGGSGGRTPVPQLPGVGSLPAAPGAPSGAPSVDLPGGLGNTSFAASMPSGDISKLQEYARQWMESPGRYGDDFVAQAMSEITARMDEVRRQTTNDTNSELAARGILSSTAGQELMGMRREAVGRQENQEQLDLLRMVADANAADKSAAFGAMASATGLAENSRQFGVNANLQARAQDLQKYGIDSNRAIAVAQMEQDAQQFGAQYALQVRAQELQAQGMAAEQAYRQAQMDFQYLQADRDEAYRQRGMDLDEAFRRDRLGFDREQWEDDRSYRDDYFDWLQDDRRREWDWRYADSGITPPWAEEGPGGGDTGGGGVIDDWIPEVGDIMPPGGGGNPWDPGYGVPDDVDPEDWRYDWDPFR